MIETVEGLVTLRQLSATPGIARLAFGNLDFGTDARVPGVGPELDSVRLQITLESRIANLPSPPDGVTVALDDAERLLTDIARARNLGFTGKLCIHPKQVSFVNEGLLPSADDLDWARRVLEAAEVSGGAVVSVDGKMVDRPVIIRAREFLSRVRNSEQH